MTKGWIELFSVGTHRDSNENQKSWTLADLQKIVASYDPKKHEAPIVLGHPEDNSPAYGWVKALKVAQGKLLGQFAQVDKAFAKWVNEGKFKKRSISLYPDLSLRHVGYLGAMPPAIKGLADHKFSEKLTQKDQSQKGSSSFFEFASDQSPEDAAPKKGAQKTNPEMSAELGTFYLLADGRILDQDGTFYDLDSPEVTAHLEADGELIGSVDDALEETKPELEDLESEIEGLKTEIEELESQSGTEEETEEQELEPPAETGPEELGSTKLDPAKIKDEKKQLEQDYKNRLAKLEQSHAQEKANSFAEGLISKGILTPAQSKGLPEFMAGLSNSSFEFGEGQGPKPSQSHREWLQNFLEQLPNQGHLKSLGIGEDQKGDLTDQDQLIESVVAGTGCGSK